MKLFLVRHGTTGLIEQGVRQTKASALSPAGIAQAKAAGNKLLPQSVEYLFSSDWTRVVETAEVMGKILNLTNQIYLDLHEITHPEELYGATKNDLIYQEYATQKVAMHTSLDWRFKDRGESLRDVIIRAQKVKHDLLSNYPESIICLVSHANFIRCFTASCILGDNFDDNAMLHLYHGLSCGNASITALELVSCSQFFQLRQLDNTNHVITE